MVKLASRLCNCPTMVLPTEKLFFIYTFQLIALTEALCCFSDVENSRRNTWQC